MTQIVAINVIVSHPSKRQPTAMLTVLANREMILEEENRENIRSMENGETEKNINN